jgi:hypothetical protein
MIDTLLNSLPALLLGICLSACAGFRIFIPLLVINLSQKFHLLPLQIGADFAWLQSNLATMILIVAALAEVLAYYLPFIDNVLDTIATPISFIAGSIIATSFLKIEDPAIKWTLGILAGGGVAGTIAAGTSILRLGSSKLTGGLGNSFLATIENILSIVLSIVAFLMPMILGTMVVLFVFWMIKKLMNRKEIPNSTT